MIPEKIEEYVFEPFLKSLFEECDAEDGYWTFLKKMYPVLYYESGDTNGCDANEPESFIYDSIIRIQCIGAILGYGDLPYDDEFLTNEWVYLDEDYHDPDYDPNSLIDIDEVPWEYKNRFGDPEVVGRNYEIHIEDVLKNPHDYQELLRLLDSDDFPIKAEFLSAREYMQKLIDKKENVGDDLFDLFQ